MLIGRVSIAFVSTQVVHCIAFGVLAKDFVCFYFFILLWSVVSQTGIAEGQHPVQTRASLPNREEPVPLQEGALQEAGQEHGTIAHAVRLG